LQKQLGKLNSKNSKIVVPQEVRLYMAKKYWHNALSNWYGAVHNYVWNVYLNL
jgi:hypothetical protein